MSIPLAFYAPLKSPHHPSPSGDRAMARLLLRALELGGFAPRLASELRSFEGAGDPGRQDAIRRESLAEAERLVAAVRAEPPQRRPRLWFTYHCYYKAPDWIGPDVARELGIPYVVAEGSRADKRAGGRWDIGHRGAERALDAADLLLVLTEADEEALRGAKPSRQRLVGLRPFLDLAEWPAAQRDRGRISGPVRLLTVAMMRGGDKLASYRLLAQALGLLEARAPHLAWTLDVAGDGPARGDVEKLLSPFAGRVRMHGEVGSRLELGRLYRTRDLLVWPAVNEAYGMALLEAQAHGCPVLAGAFGGVASVVEHGRTGILAAPGDAAAFAEALGKLAADRGRLGDMGLAAARFVAGERDLRTAAGTIAGALRSCLEGELAA